MKYFLSGHIYILIFLYPVFVKAQDIESIVKKQPVKVTGALGFNNSFYQATGINNRRPPYLWYLTGNVNISLFGWSVPLSVYYSPVTKSTRNCEYT